MSTYVVPAGRHLAPAIALVLAVLVAVALGVLGVVDAQRAGSSEARTTAPATAPTPQWLQRYLEFEAPVPDTPARAGDAPGARPVNPGLR